MLASIHEAVSDLHEIGLADAKTMREFDRLCLEPVPTPGQNRGAPKAEEGVAAGFGDDAIGYPIQNQSMLNERT